MSFAKNFNTFFAEGLRATASVFLFPFLKICNIHIHNFKRSLNYSLSGCLGTDICFKKGQTCFSIVWYCQKQPPEVFCEKGVLKKSMQNSKESTCARVSFLIKLNFIKKETLAQMFSCEFYEGFNDTHRKNSILLNSVQEYLVGCF